MPLQKARLKISQLSVNRKHKAHEQTKKVAAVSLSLTSMVDMFAILVIFLLTNNQSVEEWVKLEHGISLPQAKTVDEPKKAVTLQIAADKVYGQDAAPGSEEVVLSDVNTIARGPLINDTVKNWLVKLHNKEGYVNIVADQTVAYGAIRRIVSTAQMAGFRNINLAVVPR